MQSIHWRLIKSILRIGTGVKRRPWKTMPMQPVTLLLSGAALMQALPSYAADVKDIDTCTGQSQTDLRICLETRAKTSAAELAQAEHSAATTLRRWDEDQRYRSSAGSALQAANKSFIQFRATQCDFAAALGGGAAGNALALRRLDCVSKLNRTRAANLRQQVADLPVK